jgi:hypothetical protein
VKKRSAIISVFGVWVLAACGPNQRILESSNENGTPEGQTAVVNSNSPPPPAGFEQDLESMRTADFKFIIVFRRKDDQPMDAADKDWISRNVGAQANRRRLSDSGKAIIIGSNFPFPPLPKDSAGRFKMDNFSKPDSGPLFSNSNANM